MFDVILSGFLLSQNVYRGGGISGCKVVEVIYEHGKVVSETCQDHRNTKNGFEYNHPRRQIRSHTYRYFEHYKQQQPAYQNPNYNRQNYPHYQHPRHY